MKWNCIKFSIKEIALHYKIESIEVERKNKNRRSSNICREIGPVFLSALLVNILYIVKKGFSSILIDGIGARIRKQV